MSWEDIRWDMHLESPPVIVQTGEGIHGLSGDDIFILPHFWCLHLYAYEAELEVDGHSIPIKPGHIGINPPGATMLYRYIGRSPHLYVHFSIAAVGNTHSVPAMRDLGERYHEFETSVREVIRFWSINQHRSMVRLWDILWQLADVSTDVVPDASLPAPVANAIAYIDTHLHEPLTVYGLAAREEISHNHFTRLFKHSLGSTPIEYIQSRRSAQAKHLLIYSSVPLKAIASSIGIFDPQIFNKFVKRYLGSGPKSIRENN